MALESLSGFLEVCTLGPTSDEFWTGVAIDEVIARGVSELVIGSGGCFELLVREFEPAKS